ncbi:MAG: Gfo/Idh/MocA family oxidoreductase, partial [Clostridia bacterium]|nr:Gfo/Idh/MocA family oxidoreductase [Clostridia bacterium]
QTARKLIEDGFIGDVIGVDAHMICRGPESWHPDPEFFYDVGGGPMLDMGPYYMTALVHLLGRAKAVSGFVKKTFDVRPILNPTKMGVPMPVDVPTHEAGTILFESGVIASFTASFDSYTDRSDEIIIYGTEGTLRVPDPNTFGGDVLLLREGSRTWEKIPLMTRYVENSRALGLADMAKAIETGRDHRAHYSQQLHVVELMSSFRKSSETGMTVQLETPYTRTAPLPWTPLLGILE